MPAACTSEQEARLDQRHAQRLAQRGDGRRQLPTCRAAQTPAAKQAGPRGKVRFGVVHRARSVPAITLARRGNQSGSRISSAGRDAQLLALGAAASRHAAGLLAAHPGARGLGRHRPGRPLLPTDAAHAGRRDLPRPGARDPRCAAGQYAQHDARPPERRAGHDRLRRAALAGLHLLPALGDGPAQPLRRAQEPADGAERARRRCCSSPKAAATC